MPYDITLPGPTPYNTEGVHNALSTIIGLDQKQKAEALATKKFNLEEKTQNALQQHYTNVETRAAAEETRNAAKNDLDMFAKSAQFISAIPDPAQQEAAYTDMAVTAKQKGKEPPGGFLPPTAFKDPATGVWDNGRFQKYVTDVRRAASGVLDPKEGTMIEHVIQNKGQMTDIPAFDPTKPEGPDNARFIKVHATVQNGKVVVDPTTPATPEIDPFAKQKREEDYKAEGRKLEERRTVAAEKRAAKAGVEKPEIKPMAALAKSRQLVALVDKIKNGGKIDPIMAMLANRPELAGQDMGAVKDQASRDALLNSIQLEYDETQKFVDPKLRTPLTTAKAAPVLKPITTTVAADIRKKAKTRAEAEQMARDQGYDPMVQAK